MSEVTRIEGTQPAAAIAWKARLIKWGSFASAWSLLIISVVMIVTCLLSSVGIVLSIIELFLGAANFLAGVLLLRESLNKKHTPVIVSMWSGEIALAATFFYLGTAMPVFHQGLASPQTALIQFIAVIVGLIIGTVGLVLSGATKGIRRASSLNPVASLRDSVILIIGTILIAISLSQLAGPTLKPTQWNWISYGGITVPGMFILIAREGVKQLSEYWTGIRRILSSVVTEIMLISGLAIMLFGSYSNLTLGINGYLYLSHIKGNASGLTLWIIAALFLLLIRGPFKLAFLQGNQKFGIQIVNQLLYVAALFAFIYGERSVLTGTAPHITIGGAAPAALLILFSALLLLVPGRVLGLGRVVTQ
jgi:hypothetical protein